MTPVHYNEVEQTVRELVTAADDEKRHRFGAETVVRLTTDGDLADAAEAEFDDDAHQAFGLPPVQDITRLRAGLTARHPA